MQETNPRKNKKSSGSQERKDWESRKRQRKEEEQANKRQQTGDQENNAENASTVSSRKRRPKILPGQGHYSDPTDTSRTYLEGQVFGELLEQEMPVELWTGATQASATEKKFPAQSSLLAIRSRCQRSCTCKVTATYRGKFRVDNAVESSR